MKGKNTDNMASGDFLKTRSYSGCIRAALNLLCANFATIFRKTWLYAAVLSVVCGAFAFVSVPAVPDAEGSVNITPYFVALIETAALTVCATVANSRTKAGLLSLLNGAAVKTNFRNHMKVSFILLGICIAFVVAALASSIATARYMLGHKMQPETTDNVITGLLAAFFIINILAFLPFAYSATRVLLRRSRTKEMFGRSYRVGVRRFGFLFIIGTIISLVLMIVGVFTALPALITTLASRTDSFGVENGDPTGLPAYFPWLSFLTNTVVCFFMTYIIFWIDLTFCYAYGTIETDLSESLTEKKQGNEGEIRSA